MARETLLSQVCLQSVSNGFMYHRPPCTTRQDNRHSTHRSLPCREHEKRSLCRYLSHSLRGAEVEDLKTHRPPNRFVSGLDDILLRGNNLNGTDRSHSLPFSP